MSNFCPTKVWLILCWAGVIFAEKDITRLRNFLLQKYDKTLRPVVKDNETTIVRMAYIVQHLFEVDEKTEILASEGIIKMEWTDVNLKWKPEDYGNISIMHLADHEVWQPDVYLFRSLGDSSVDEDKSTFIRVTSEGQMTWVPPASLKVPCTVNYTYFPFEVHRCDFEFGSWTHDGDALLLLPYDNFAINPSEVTSGEWRITSWIYETEVYFVSELQNPYNSVHLRLSLQRSTSLYRITSVIPVITSSLLTLAGFWLDIWSTPRYVLGIGNFAVVALQLLHLGSTLPAGRNTPLLAQFSAATVLMSAAFLVFTSTLDCMQRRRSPPPEGLVRLCRSLPDIVISLQAHSQSEGEEEDKVANDWLLVCRVIDRIAFWVFSVVYVVIASLLLSVA